MSEPPQNVHGDAFRVMNIFEAPHARRQMRLQHRRWLRHFQNANFSLPIVHSSDMLFRLIDLLGGGWFFKSLIIPTSMGPRGDFGRVMLKRDFKLGLLRVLNRLRAWINRSRLGLGVGQNFKACTRFRK